MRPIEITDLIVDFDPETLERRPVLKKSVLERLDREGASSSAKRLWETMSHGRRVALALSAMIEAARRGGHLGTIGEERSR